MKCAQPIFDGDRREAGELQGRTVALTELTVIFDHQDIALPYVHQDIALPYVGGGTSQSEKQKQFRNELSGMEKVGWTTRNDAVSVRLISLCCCPVGLCYRMSLER